MRPFSNPKTRWLVLALKMLIGVFFLVSAVAKLADMDRFEVYVFSFQWFSLGMAFLVARLVVVCELLLGLGLLVNVANRWVHGCTILMLTGFTLFLGYTILVGRNESCQCMGALVEISPAWSLLKNAVLLLLMVPVCRLEPWPWRPRWFVWLPAVLAPLVVVFVVSVPDNWRFRPDATSYADSNPFSTALQTDSVLDGLQLRQGHQAVLFLTPGCRFCQMADQKLQTIAQRNRLDPAAVHYVIPAGAALPPGTTAEQYYSHPAVQLSDSVFMQITHGMRPLLFLVEDGHVMSVSHYRNMDEGQIVRFLPSASDVR